MATDQARLAVDTRAFPLLIHDPRKGDTIEERLSLQGNPATGDDWWVNPKTGESVDFIDFARSEGRFSKHFDKEGNPSATLLRGQEDRLDNWHILQELAGIRGKKSVAKKESMAKAPAKAAVAGGNGNGISSGAKIQYNARGTWIDGVIESLEPAVLTLDDDTVIEVPKSVLNKAIDEGLVKLK